MVLFLLREGRLLFVVVAFLFLCLLLVEAAKKKKYYYATTNPNRPFSCANVELRYFGQRRGTKSKAILDKLCCRGRNDTCVVAPLLTKDNLLTVSQQHKMITNWEYGKKFWWWTPPKYFSDLKDGICYCDDDCQAAYKTHYKGKADVVDADCCPDFQYVCKRDKL